MSQLYDFWGIFMTFLFDFTMKRGKYLINYVIVASIDVWESYFAHTYCQIHFMLFFFSLQINFCCNSRTFAGKIVLPQALLV